MKIFISWSKERSKAVAEALRVWLPRVIQSSQPWMSAKDIDKGVLWRTEISRQLNEAAVGIICLTPENLESPWLLFEAGAISKEMAGSLVCTYLFDLEPYDVKDPLAQFQSTKAQEEDTRKLIQSINRLQGVKALPDDILSDVFNAMWPKLEKELSEIKPIEPQPRLAKSELEILEELVGMVKSQSKEQSDLRTDVLELLSRKKSSDPLQKSPAYYRLLSLYAKAKQLDDDIYSVISTHTIQPEIHTNIQAISEEISELLKNKRDYTPYNDKLLNLGLAIKRMAFRLSDAEDMVSHWREGAIDTKPE